MIQPMQKSEGDRTLLERPKEGAEVFDEKEGRERGKGPPGERSLHGEHGVGRRTMPQRATREIKSPSPQMKNEATQSKNAFWVQEAGKDRWRNECLMQTWHTILGGRKDRTVAIEKFASRDQSATKKAKKNTTKYTFHLKKGKDSKRASAQTPGGSGRRGQQQQPPDKRSRRSGFFREEEIGRSKRKKTSLIEDSGILNHEPLLSARRDLRTLSA